MKKLMKSVIEMTPQVYRDYKRSIALNEPETVALLGGSLDKPNLITEFRFCPPEKERGIYQNSASHVSIDNDLMNWILVNEFEPNKQFVVGLWHSHPQGVSSPSGQYGDLGFFEKCLNHEYSIEKGWTHLLAPITTFDNDGKDQIHGWIYERNAKKAYKADMKIVVDEKAYSPKEFEQACINGDFSKRVTEPNELDQDVSPIRFIVEFDDYLNKILCTQKQLKNMDYLSRRQRSVIKRLYGQFVYDKLNQYLSQAAEAKV